MEVKNKSSILADIKQATRVKHDEIEQNTLMKAVADNTIDRPDYYQLLYKFYGFHKAAEQVLLNTTLWQQYNFDINARRKTSLLSKDLTYLGYQGGFEEIPLCKNLPNLTNDAARLGFLYVIEGSTLGGQVLSRQLKQKFDFSQTKGASYFNSYGKENLRNMWFGFQALLENYVSNNESQAEAIMSSASETFDKLNIWLGK